MCYVLSFIICF
jgi:hypothetical protein